MSKGVDLEAELDRLYTLPLKDFVKGRDELAAHLKASGDKDAAAGVKALKKPGLAAWAVNQLPSHAPKVWKALVEAADRLRGVSASELREALQVRRDAVNAARREAERILVGAGHAAETATTMKIAGTLEALGTYGSEPGHPAAGRLTEELEAPGFDEIAALALPQVPAPRPVGVPAPKPVTSPRPEPPKHKEAKEPQVDELALARARKEAARAKAELEVREKKADEAKARLRAAEERAEFGARERQELERKLEKAAQEAERTAEAAGKARDAMKAAAEAVAEAREALETAEAELARVERGSTPARKKR